MLASSFLWAILNPITVQSDDIHHSEVLEFGDQQIPYRGTCLFWGGGVSSDDFFRGLKRKDTSHGPIFRKGPDRVNFYPEHLQIVIRVGQHECDKHGVASFSSLVIPDQMAVGLSFKAQWKDEMQLQPAEDFVQLPFKRKSKIYSVAGEEFSTNLIEYTFTLSSQNTPLTRHLIVTVTMPDGQQLIRLAAFP
ncbi:MAG TPA: hypothetical protein VGF19_00900 [Candidatus Acidoferrum sp.]